MHSAAGKQQEMSSVSQAYFDSDAISALTADLVALGKKLGPQATTDSEFLKKQGELMALMAEKQEDEKKSRKQKSRQSKKL
jgi:hypothetical protein